MIEAMKTLPRAEANQLWRKFWSEMSREWFKVEALQDYTAEDDGPALRAWLAGDKKRSLRLISQNIDPKSTEEFQHKLRQGVKFRRFHVVDRPYTAYIEWEIEHYKRVNQPVWGELVRLVNRLDIADLVLPAGDFMVFDDRRAVVNDYNSAGLVVSQTFYDETDDISWLLKLKPEIIRAGKSLG